MTCGVVLQAAGARVAVPRVPVPLAAPPAARLPAPALPHHVQPQGAPQADTGKYTHPPTLLPTTFVLVPYRDKIEYPLKKSDEKSNLTYRD